MKNAPIEILLIEDDLAAAGVIRTMLAESGKQDFSVQHVRNLADGLEMLRSRAFDVILVDLALPDSHGIETALSVRNQAKTTPIVVMTVPNDEEAAVNALQSVIQDYLIKGKITDDALKRSIRYAIQRQRDMEACLQYEQWFASFMLHLPAAAWAKDLQGRYVYANEGDERIFSMPFSEYSGKRDEEFLPPETASQLRRNDEQVLAEGVSLQTVEFLRQADGIEHHYMVNKFPIPGADGQAAYVAGIALDITERAKAVEALRKSERKFAKIFHGVPALVGISTLEEGRFVDVNDTTTQLLGYRREEIIGRTALELNIWEDQADRAAMLRALEEKGSVKNLEVRLRGKSGQRLVGLFSAEYIDINGERYMLSLIRDITERKGAEEALQKSERKLAKIFHAVPALVSITTLGEGRIVDINETALQTLGYQRNEVIGRTTRDIDFWLDISDRDRVLQVLAELGSVRNFEFAFRGKTGQIFAGLLSAELIDIDGERCLLTLIKDITLKRRAEKQVERLNADLAARAAELEEANQDLEAFNYTVAHDLRKPLSTINGYCQLILEFCGAKLDEQCTMYLKEAYDGTWRMNSLIDTLLDFSRTARIEPRRERVDLSGMAQLVAVELQQAEPARRGTFRIANDISVVGDADLLRVVLENLLGNAWKYTGIREEAFIEFGTTEIDGEPVCFVRDNGPGFAREDADKLFTPFQRLPGVEEIKGFGIGLATVDRIIRRHGGRIWAEGEPGKGATFWFTLGHGE